jgi:DNA-binding NarL/FixJ family response regulator
VTGRKPITVLLADDQDLIRDALRALLAHEPGLTVVGQARTGLEAVSEASRLKPDVIIMDVRMPGLTGPAATARITQNRGDAGPRVLVLSTFEDGEVIRACLRAGADGFIGKGASTRELIDAIYAVYRGESAISAGAARQIFADSRPDSASRESDAALVAGLTARELDIVRLVGLGITDEEIGRRLSISPATSKTHVRNAMRKLGVHGRAQLVAVAHRAGLMSGPARRGGSPLLDR